MTIIKNPFLFVILALTVVISNNAFAKTIGSIAKKDVLIEAGATCGSVVNGDGFVHCQLCKKNGLCDIYYCSGTYCKRMKKDQPKTTKPFKPLPGDNKAIIQPGAKLPLLQGNLNLPVTNKLVNFGTAQAQNFNYTAWSAQARQCQPDSDESNTRIYGGWVFRPGRTGWARLVCTVPAIMETSGADARIFEVTYRDTDGWDQGAELEVCFKRKNHRNARVETLDCISSNDHGAQGVKVMGSQPVPLNDFGEWAYYFVVRMHRATTSDDINLHSLKLIDIVL